MRFLFATFVLFDQEEYRIIRHPSDKDGVGSIKILAKKRSASVLTVIRNLVSASKGRHHLYVTIVASGFEHESAMYADVDYSGITWVVSSSKSVADGPLPVIKGLDSAVSRWIYFQNKSCWPVDAVFATTPYTASQISRMFSSKTRVVPGVARHESSIDEKGVSDVWGTPGSNLFHREMMAATSVGVSHLFLNEKQRRIYFDSFMRPFLSPSTMRRLWDGSAVEQNGVDLQDVDSEIGEVKWGRGRVAGSFYVLTEWKGTPAVIDLYGRMSAAGEIDKAIVTSARDGSIDDMMPFGSDSKFEFYNKCSRPDYLRQAARSSVAIFNSRDEASPICPIEVAYTGCTPLFPDRPWVRDTVGKSGWKLIYRNMDEAHSMMLKVLEEPDVYGKMSREFVSEHYDNDRRGARFLDYVEGVARSENKFMRMSDSEFSEFVDGSKIIESIHAAFAGSKEVAWPDLARKVYMPRNALGDLVVMSWHDLPAVMDRAMSIKDDLTKSVPTFRRA